MSLVLHYYCITDSYCEILRAQISDFVIVNEEQDLVMEGSSVTFTCPPGRILTGPNTSTCMGDGQLYPDPRKLDCAAPGCHNAKFEDLYI